MKQKQLGSIIFNNIKKFRTESGLTQPQLAAKVSKLTKTNISREYISLIENQKRRPHLDVALAFCKALGRTPSDTWYINFNI